MKKYKEYLSLFATGLLQVALVSLNTYLTAHQHLLSATLVGFGISFVWTFNVKKVAFGNMWYRIAYALGAAVGTLVGILTAIIFW